MGPVRAEIEIDAPRERVFAVISDLALRQSFTDHFISELRLARIESTGVGAAARFRFLVPPQAQWMQTQITAVEAPHRLSERGYVERRDDDWVVTPIGAAVIPPRT